MKLFIHALIAITLIIAPIAAQAQEQTIPQERPAITEALVQNVLKSFRALKTEFKDQKPSNLESIGDQLESKESREKVDAIVKKFGYKNFPDWQGDVVNVALVYGAYRHALEAPGQAEVNAQIQKIYNSPKLSDAQKESMIKLINSANTTVSKMANASGDEIAIVKKHEKEIKEIFDR